MRKTLKLALLFSALSGPIAAHAEAEAPPPSVDLSANLAIVSDYRFRGISLSSRKPAVQGGVDLSFASGLFLGTWASNIAKYGGSNVEVDLYGGYGGSVAGLDYTAGVYAYAYPGGNDVNYIELQSTIGKTIGPVTTALTVAFIPDQWNTTRDSLYLGVNSDVAIGGTPLTASFGAGRENGGYDEKWDWSAGLSYSLDILTLSVSYVDSNYSGAAEAGRNGRAGVFGSVKADF